MIAMITISLMILMSCDFEVEVMMVVTMINARCKVVDCNDGGDDDDDGDGDIYNEME